MKKIIASLLIFSIGLFNSSSFAANSSIELNSNVTLTFWQQCWTTITGVNLGPSAQQTLFDVEKEYTINFAVPFIAEIQKQSSLKIQAAGSANKSVILTLVKNHQDIAAAKHKMEMSTLDSEMAFMESLAEAEIKNQHKGFFTDGNGEDGTLIKNSNSYKYAAAQCTRSKIMKSVASTESRKDDANQLSESTKSQETENSKVLSVEGFQNILQKNHFEKYCSETEHEGGLCEDSAKYPLGDINATKFLFPEGTGSMDVNEDGFFKTRYTYNPDEIEVSKDFIKNIIFATPTRKPTISEQKRSSKAEFVLAYNRKYAALNLANYSFQLAHEKRIAKTSNKEGTPMSHYDMYRYQMENTLSADGKLAVQNAKKKGVDFMVYSAMLVENNLELERMKQQERIENLLSAINAARINNPISINALNSLK